MGLTETCRALGAGASQGFVMSEWIVLPPSGTELGQGPHGGAGRGVHRRFGAGVIGGSSVREQGDNNLDALRSPRPWLIGRTTL